MNNRMITTIAALTVSTVLGHIGWCQGTVRVSTLDETTVGSHPIASDSGVRTWFRTGPATDGYFFDSIELSLGEPIGNPSGFSIRFLGDSMSLVGPDPIEVGVFRFEASGTKVLEPFEAYWFEVTASSPEETGAYTWNYSARETTSSQDLWSISNRHEASSDGINWTRDTPSLGFQYAVNAIAVPEPSTVALLLSGGMLGLARSLRSRRTCSARQTVQPKAARGCIWPRADAAGMTMFLPIIHAPNRSRSRRSDDWSPD